MSHCHDEIEGKSISPEAEQRLRELLDPSTTTGRVCLRMLEHGEKIGAACIAEHTDPHTVMAEWHQLTDANDIVSVDGRRPCISVLNSAWERRWSTATDQVAWVAVDAGLLPSPLAGPQARR